MPEQRFLYSNIYPDIAVQCFCGNHVILVDTHGYTCEVCAFAIQCTGGGSPRMTRRTSIVMFIYKDE